MTQSRYNLTPEHAEMMDRLIQEIYNNNGNLSDKFAEELYNSDFVVTDKHKGFKLFVMQEIVPKLNNVELLNFTESMMNAHMKYDESGNGANLLRANARLSGQLYWACVEGRFNITNMTDGNLDAKVKPLNDIIYNDWTARGVNANDIVKGVDTIFGMRQTVRDAAGERIQVRTDNATPFIDRMNQALDALQNETQQTFDKLLPPKPTRSVPAPAQKAPQAATLRQSRDSMKNTPAPGRPTSEKAAPPRPRNNFEDTGLFSHPHHDKNTGPSVPARPKTSFKPGGGTTG